MEPSKHTAEERPKRRKPSLVLAAALLALLLILAPLVLLGLRTCSPDAGARDPNAALGQLNGKSPEEIQAALGDLVAEGMFSISIASVAEFADGSSEGELRIENAPNNRYLMKVTVMRDDTGEAVYESGVIEPNHHIQRARLAVDLPAGTYPCTASFEALDPETEQPVGRAEAGVRVIVHG